MMNLSLLPRRKPVEKPLLVAVCHTCQKQHAISRSQLLTTHAIVRWETKHKGHVIEFLNPEAYDLSASRRAVGEYRHNADIDIAYAASVAYTITLASLAESSSRLTGRESTAVSNTANLYLDYLIGGVITAGTSPTAGEQIEVSAFGAINDTPTYPDVFDGTDSAETITSANVKNGFLRNVAQITVDNTTDRAYYFGLISLAQLFGRTPTHHGLFVAQSTDVNLNSTGGNHVISYTPVYATVT